MAVTSHVDFAAWHTNRLKRGEVLQNFGRVRREVAEALAVAEYEKFDAHRRMIEAADVDALTANVMGMKK